MARWSEAELDRIGGAEELQLASKRTDGSLRPYVTMWVIRAGNALYVRSAGGPDRPWYRRAKASGTGRIRADGFERDVTFADATLSAHVAIDHAYHALSLIHISMFHWTEQKIRVHAQYCVLALAVARLMARRCV